MDHIVLLVQERLTKQIAEALTETITPRGVGVVIEATYVLRWYIHVYTRYTDLLYRWTPRYDSLRNIEQMKIRWLIDWLMDKLVGLV